MSLNGMSRSRALRVEMYSLDCEDLISKFQNESLLGIKVEGHYFASKSYSTGTSRLGRRFNFTNWSLRVLMV